MSVTIEDKVELFSKIIFGSIEEMSSQKKERLGEAHKKELEELSKDVEKRKEEFVQAAIKRAERERVKLIAKTTNEQQHVLLNKKQQAIQTVMGRLQEYARNFTDTEDYKDYMKKSIESIITTLDKSKQITFYVMEKDFQLVGHILEQKLVNTDNQIKYDIKKTTNNIIGGIIAEDMLNPMQLDLTLTALIDEYKETVGAAITHKFDEVSSL
jgi:V/A-type H+/Na+-transporting ATPase subunit E